jgi:hypothetical protein
MVRAMADFTPLERAALEAIMGEMGEDRDRVAEQLRHASVISRENTGGGFFSDLSVASHAHDLDRKTAHWGRNVWISIDGLEYGLGMILHLKDFRANLLEGYAVGPEDTSAINFETVRFAIASEPGRLPPNVS